MELRSHYVRPGLLRSISFRAELEHRCVSMLFLLDFHLFATFRAARLAFRQMLLAHELPFNGKNEAEARWICGRGPVEAS